MRQVMVVIVAALVLQGCATAYQPKGYSGGFSETQLDENVFTVSFSGNEYTSREQVTDFTLLRSAELALQNGYQYFAVVDARTFDDVDTYTSPIRAQTTTDGYGTATTTTSGGKTYTSSAPSASNTIVCFREKPESPFTYNAQFIKKSVRQKYAIAETTE